jgi:hypothetical protein
MRVLSLLLISLNSFLPDPAFNGVKIVTRQVTGGFSDTRTEYLTSNRLRSEWQTHMGERSGPAMASIFERGNTNRVFVLDLQAHEYITYETDSQGSALGVRQHPVTYSGGMLQIWIDSSDTGERQQMFGHAARHIITREKRIATPGACSRSSESVTDGWYIDESVMPEWRRPKKNGGGGVVVATLVAVSSSNACLDKVDRIDVHRTGTDPGFPLKVTTTMKSEVSDPDGGKRTLASTWGSEVTELQEGPLDPALFEVPNDFRRVEALKNWYAPAPRRQPTGWEWFKAKLEEIFR